MKYYYEIHVTGKNGFSTTVVSDQELNAYDVIILAVEQNKIDEEDSAFVDYVKQISYDEWNENFNFDK